VYRAQQAQVDLDRSRVRGRQGRGVERMEAVHIFLSLFFFGSTARERRVI
jgi:hypothetical protein